MTTVKIAELKNRLSHYLRRVLVSLPEDDAKWLARLERRGVVRRATGKLSAPWLARRPRIGVDVVAALLDERAEGR